MFTHPKLGTSPARLTLALSLILAMAGAGVAPIVGQQAGPRGPWPDPSKAIQVTVAPNVPLSIASQNTEDTTVQVRGALLVIDLRCNLVIRNESSQYLRGVTFGVLAEKLAAGGRASVAIPSLNVEPEGSFPVHLNLRLLRPLPASPDDVITVDVDGVLLADFSFFGPDQFNSRRRMTVWEMQANRDRRYFKSLLDLEGRDRLREAIMASLDRQLRRPRLEARLLQPPAAPRLDAKPEATGRRPMKVGFVNISEAPLEMVSGTALVQGATTSSPRVTVKNRSGKEVRYFELGWLVSDPAGNRYAAGSVPGPSTSTSVPPGGVASLDLERQIFFTPVGNRGSNFAIGGMSGYISQVQFGDGTFWIPTRSSLEEATLIDTTPVSAEEQRLTTLYVSRGLDRLVQELSQF